MGSPDAPDGMAVVLAGGFGNELARPMSATLPCRSAGLDGQRMEVVAPDRDDGAMDQSGPPALRGCERAVGGTAEGVTIGRMEPAGEASDQVLGFGTEH